MFDAAQTVRQRTASILFMIETLNQYERTANELLASSDKHAIAQAARLLALYVGYYQLRYGPVPPSALPTGNSVSTPEEIADRAEAMRVLAAALCITGTIAD